MQAQALRNMKPLPKRMLPSRMQLLKSVLRVFRAPGMQPAMAGMGQPRYSSGRQSFQPQLPQPDFQPPQTLDFREDADSAPPPITSPGMDMFPGFSGPSVEPELSPQQGAWAFVEEEETPEAVPQIHPDRSAPESIPEADEPVMPKPLAKVREEKGLKPGAWDQGGLEKKIMQRAKELRDRRLYLKDFWYAAGEGSAATTL